MINVFILEDEPLIRQYLLRILDKFRDKLRIVGTASHLTEAILLLKNQPADLLLLDIELPDGVSFTLFETFPEYEGQAIFITAHNDFAIRAIKHSALDYILKPINDDELMSALQKVIKNRKNAPVQYQLLRANYESIKGKLPENLILKNANAIHVVKIMDIIRLEADNNYTVFYLTDGQKILVSKTLKSFVDILEPHHFFRSHQSHLINLSFVKKIDKYQGLTVILSNGAEIPISSRRKDALLSAFSNRRI